MGLRTRKELASELHVSFSTLSNWFASKTCPDLRMGNDQRLIEVLSLASRDQLQRLPEVVERLERGDQDDALTQTLMQIEPGDIPDSVIIAALLQKGLPLGTIDIILDQLRQAQQDQAPDRRAAS